MNTWAVAKPRGPFGSASTRRGVARLIRIQSSTAGGFRPAAAAIAGMCSSRFVEPPNAAWTSIAFSIGGGGEDLTDRHAQQVETLQRGGGAAGELEPDRFARRRERAVRQRQAQRFGDHLRRGRRAEELTAAA